MPDLTELDPSTARDWIARWDRQQEVYLADREGRFTALIDAVEADTGRPDPLVLDLGCGPGSLAVRLLTRLPRATVIAVDADPVTLSLGRAAYRNVPGLRFFDVDLRAPGWETSLGLDQGRPVDAVVSTTALHWLTAAELHELYRVVVGLLRPGGLFLDGDHLRLDEGEAPVLARLDRMLEHRENQRRFPDGHAGREDWEQWWQAVAADPALADAVAERERRAVHHAGEEGALLSVHAGALREAGFTEVGTLWQRGANRLLAAVRLGASPPEETPPDQRELWSGGVLRGVLVSGKPVRYDLGRERGDRRADLVDGVGGHPCRGEGIGEVVGDLVEVRLADASSGVCLPHARTLVEVGTAERGSEELDLPALEFRHIRAGKEACELWVGENSFVEVIHDRHECRFAAYRFEDTDLSGTAHSGPFLSYPLYYGQL